MNSRPELVKAIKTYTSYLVPSCVRRGFRKPCRFLPGLSGSPCYNCVSMMFPSSSFGPRLGWGDCWSLNYALSTSVWGTGLWFTESITKWSTDNLDHTEPAVRPLGRTHHLPNSRLAVVSIPIRMGISSGFSAINGENGR